MKDKFLYWDILLYCGKQASNHLDQVYLFTPNVSSEAPGNAGKLLNGDGT